MCSSSRWVMAMRPFASHSLDPEVKSILTSNKEGCQKGACHDPSKSESPTCEKRSQKSMKKTSCTCKAAKSRPALGIMNADLKDCRRSSRMPAL